MMKTEQTTTTFGPWLAHRHRARYAAIIATMNHGGRNMTNSVPTSE
jgi:hypothetical protein